MLLLYLLGWLRAFVTVFYGLRCIPEIKVYGTHRIESDATDRSARR